MPNYAKNTGMRHVVDLKFVDYLYRMGLASHPHVESGVYWNAPPLSNNGKMKIPEPKNVVSSWWRLASWVGVSF